MRVALTGGTGFVGSHTTARLLAHGHQPRLLVRDPAKAARVLSGLGIDLDAVDLVVGDMGDPTAVGSLLDGAEAVIHAAAAIGVTGPRSDLVTQNVQGVEHVVGQAVARGLDPVVHVSTVAVFVPPHQPTITTDAPLASPRTDYGRSKVAAEQYARRLQDDGAPVTIVYPGGVLGPGQPTLDSMMEGLAGALSSVWPMPDGGVALVHVEDLAEALARAVVPGRGARRLLLGGDYLRWPELADLCDELTGVPCRRMVIPGWAMLALGQALDAAKRVRTFDYPLTRDAAEVMVTMVPTDDAATLAELDLELRPVRASLEEALRCLAADGHLPPARAGRLAPEVPAAPVTERAALLDRVQTWVRHHVVPRLTGTALFTRIGPRIVPPLDRFASHLTRGRFTVSDLTAPSLVLTTTGHRSGEPREVPLACVVEPGGSWLVVGSNFGRERHPAWTANLLHEPRAVVRRRGRSVPVSATLLEGPARAEAWGALMRLLPVYDAYEARAHRDLRVFRLTPT
jgi:deazaflavin-dependent oxidoreductase (nitroreductase family)